MKDIKNNNILLTFFLIILLIFKPSYIYLLSGDYIDLNLSSHIYSGKYEIEFNNEKVVVIDCVGDQRRDWIIENLKVFHKRNLKIDCVSRIDYDLYSFIGSSTRTGHSYIIYHGCINPEYIKTNAMALFDVIFVYHDGNPVFVSKDTNIYEEQMQIPNTWYALRRGFSHEKVESILQKMKDAGYSNNAINKYRNDVNFSIYHHSVGLDFMLNKIFFTPHKTGHPVFTYQHIQLALDKGQFFNYQRNYINEKEAIWLWKTLQSNYVWYISYSDMYKHMNLFTEWAEINGSDELFFHSEEETQKVIINKFKKIMNNYLEFSSKFEKRK